MRYPQMAELSKQTQSVENWMGYHHVRRCSDGESYDEKNMAGDEYPIMAPRKKRGTYAKPVNPQGLIAKDCLCWIDGSKFVMDGQEYEMNLSEAAEECPKEMVSMGAYVIILPDKKYINTKNPEDRGDIEARFTTSGEVRFSICDVDGDGYKNVVAADTEPEDPADGTYWINTGSKPQTLSKWSEYEAMWLPVATTYVKIEAEGIGKDFKEMDGVELSGGEGNEEIKPLMGSQVIWRKVDDNCIIIVGILSSVVTISEPVTIERRMPNLDYIIESGNRLWGCRYGLARNGEFVNEIYASKQGDFRNWNVFMGLSTDSWVGNCGSDGAWTGAINYLGSPIFFKEGHIHRVYGIMPSQYSITDTVCQGVQQGSNRSLAMVQNVLLYKSTMGVFAYDGSMPAEISEALGSKSYRDAVAGGHGYRYYLSMVDMESGEPVLFTYDVKKGIWHKEDELRPQCWCSAGKEMYCIDSASKNILSVTGAGEPEEESIEWEVVTGEIGLEQNSGFAVVSMPEEKYISKLAVRMQMDEDAKVELWIQYDGLGDWEKVASIHGSGRTRSFTLPIRPKRCDWLRLKIKGVGMARIYSLTRWMEGGSVNTDNNGAVLDF